MGDRVVEGVGPMDAKIFIVGEAPGWDEVREGVPFCGRAGNLLNAVLKKVGISRGDCRIDNVRQGGPQFVGDVSYHIPLQLFGLLEVTCHGVKGTG